MMPDTGNYGWYVAGAVLVLGLAIAWAIRRDRSGSDSGGLSDPGPSARDRSHRQLADQ
jgi:hypothetical protein